MLALTTAPLAAAAEGGRERPDEDSSASRASAAWLGPDPPPGNPCRPHCAHGALA